MAREQQIHAARNALAEQLDAASHELARGAKLALLVVLAVLGQVALGHDAQMRPRCTAIAALNSPRSIHKGMPTTITRSSFALSLTMSASAVSAASRSACW